MRIQKYMLFIENNETVLMWTFLSMKQCNCGNKLERIHLNTILIEKTLKFLHTNHDLL